MNKKITGNNTNSVSKNGKDGLYPSVWWKILPWLVCGLAALFYCYAYFLRVYPGFMAHDLRTHFHIGASAFGSLTAFYYYAYTPMQLPVGILADRYGSRMVLSIASLVCVIGLAFFVDANQIVVANIGRFLIGFGAAFGYISVLKLATHWLPERQFATAAGATSAMGMSAAMVSEMLLPGVVQHMGYQFVLNCALVAGLILTVIIALLVRNAPSHPAYQELKRPDKHLSFGKLFHYLKIILKNPYIWLVGFIGCLLYLPASVFLDTWGNAYLGSVYGLSANEAGFVSSVIFLGWIIGGPIIGAISDYIELRCLPLAISAFIAAALLGIIFYVPGISFHMLCIIGFIFGFSCGSHPLCFAIAREYHIDEVSGSTISVVNTLIMLGGVVFQPIVGYILDWHWTGVISYGERVYSPANYTWALSLVPIGVLIGGILVFFLKETHCQVVQAEKE